jgi:opacity protein-like surface antigen
MKKLIFALIAGATAMGAVHAQEGHPYVGVGVATVDHTFDIGGATGVDTSGFKASGKIFGGYDIDKTWGVEAGYTDFRKSTSHFTFNNAPGTAETKGDAYYIAGKATAPINDQFSVFGKLGVEHSKSDLTSFTPGLADRSDSDTGVYAGIGAQYNLSQQVALSLEYERYGKSRDFGAKPDVWTVAAKYSF